VPRTLFLLGSLCVLSALPGCRFVKTGSVQSGAPSGAADPKARAEAVWKDKMVAYAGGKAVPYAELAAGLAAAPDATVKTHGYAAGGDAKPVMYVRIDGTVTGANVASRAGTIDVDVDGDGKADVVVQIGPVIRGSVLRDGLDFVPFSSFSNQIDYADFSRALNAHVRDVVLKGVERDRLQGRHVHMLGAFFLDPSQPHPLVTPIELTFAAGAP
jgi:predicted lipoprotein